MKYILGFFFFLFLIIQSFYANKISYLEPQPGAKLVNTNNNIIIGFENPVSINYSDLKKSLVVTGSKSMRHEGTLIICQGNKKLIFNPSIPFSPDEKVTVEAAGKLSKTIFSNKKFSYTFTTAATKIPWNPMNSFNDEINNSKQMNNDYPQMLPMLNIIVDNNPSNGQIFLSNYSASGIPAFLIITDKNGNPYWYQQRTWNCDDFKMQPNGHLTFYDVGLNVHFELDVNYNIVNSYQCGNGYTTDGHELRLLSNGHAFVLAYDPELVNMHDSIQGGNQNATVVGLIVQEVDNLHNVYFQWRSWDHFSILDAWHQNLLSNNIDAVHGNAIEIDNDSNIIISSRHLDEITKINRSTGEIMWRLGGKNNQFTFLGDTLKFTYQHAIRRISNGDLTLYDNGNYHNPPFSRAVEYSMDLNNHTVNTVWEYRHTPNIYGSAMGYVQRLSIGNTLIAWGWTNPTVTEVQPNGAVVFEMSLPQNVVSYRVYKLDWNGPPLAVKNEQGTLPKSYELGQNYPNPFNPSTKISYSIPASEQVKISVFDILGQLVQLLVNEKENPGTYEIEWNASSFPSGVYFYKLQAGNFSETKKMTLIK